MSRFTHLGEIEPIRVTQSTPDGSLLGPVDGLGALGLTVPGGALCVGPL